MPNYLMMKKHIKQLLLLLLILVANPSFAQKREFRGAWIQAVNGQFVGLSTAAMQQKLSRQLDILKADGVNAIIFQVRPECDALYHSDIEPWSRYLTGQQGRAPQPYWDPLEWMVAECHKRGMELHAWINPYRAKTKGTTALAVNHIAARHPERVFTYAEQYILNPALKENADYICRVADDIVSRYDIDGFHIDDYFYPYPVAGEDIPDGQYFQTSPRGFKTIGDWRRDNVSRFVKQLGETIHRRKPWVKFGVSPFGIYHNARRGGSVPGSDTNGLENYDDLYADVLQWVNQGWVDYVMPQLYWQIGHPVADYATLIRWWSKYATNRPLIIGESVENTIKYPDPSNPQSHQLLAKMNLERSLGVAGSCQWYGAAFSANKGNYAEALRQLYFSKPALPPAMPFIYKKNPGKVRKLKPVWTEDGYILFWTAPQARSVMDEAQKYVVYRFAAGEPVNTDDASHIVEITSNTFLKLPYDKGLSRYTYVVTSLNRIGSESRAKKKSVKL